MEPEDNARLFELLTTMVDISFGQRMAEHLGRLDYGTLSEVMALVVEKFRVLLDQKFLARTSYHQSPKISLTRMYIEAGVGCRSRFQIMRTFKNCDYFV